MFRQSLQFSFPQIPAMHKLNEATRQYINVAGLDQYKNERTTGKIVQLIRTEYFTSKNPITELYIARMN